MSQAQGQPDESPVTPDWREPEREEVTRRTVVCDGGEGALGHPRVYLTMGPNETQVECPYCDKVFVLKS